MHTIYKPVYKDGSLYSEMSKTDAKSDKISYA